MVSQYKFACEAIESDNYLDNIVIYEKLKNELKDKIDKCVQESYQKRLQAGF